MSSLIIQLKDLAVHEHLGVLVNTDYANKIKELLKAKFDSLKRAGIALGINHGSLSDLGKRCVRLFAWKKIFKTLSIDLNELGFHTIKIFDKWVYDIRFPYEITPLAFRLVGHIIGDGGDYVNGARWIQKDATPIINLQKELLGFNGRKNKNKYGVEQAPIMAIYPKLVAAALKIERGQLRSKCFINACMGLHRDFRVQVVAALIEDESRIQPKSGSIRIAMADYEIMNALRDLMCNLGYETSKIVKIRNQGFKNNHKCFLFSMCLRILGSHKFYEDIKVARDKYGNLAGLWKKQHQLEELILLNNGRKAIGEKINSDLSTRALRVLEENNNDVITYKELKLILNTSHHRTGSVIRRLLNKGLVRAYKRGCYTLKKENYC